jgi:hypothetical protein
MSQAVLIPTLPPESNKIEIPRSMNPEERAKLIAELGAISTEIARVQTRDEERSKFAEQRWRAVDARLAKLEGHADKSGAHDLAIVTKALDKATAANDKIKWWAVSIGTTLLTSAIVGLVVHYLAAR